MIFSIKFKQDNFVKCSKYILFFKIKISLHNYSISASLTSSVPFIECRIERRKKNHKKSSCVKFNTFPRKNNSFICSSKGSSQMQKC